MALSGAAAFYIRIRPVEEKRRIVAESAKRRYGLSTGQLFTWRRLVREGRLGADAEL